MLSLRLLISRLVTSAGSVVNPSSSNLFRVFFKVSIDCGFASVVNLEIVSKGHNSNQNSIVSSVSRD
jgi:hypothetical protein